MTVDIALPVDHLLARPRAVDVGELLDLVHACDLATVGFPDFTADDVREWLDAPFTRPDEDGWTVRDAGQRLVAWAYIESSYGERVEDAAVYVHPGANPALHRALVDLLVARCAERAVAAGRAEHELMFWCTNEPHLADVVASAGARRTRTFARMRRELDGTEGAFPPPAGVTVGGVDPDDDAQLREFHAVYVEAFGSHFAFEPSTYEAWRAHVAAAPNVPYDQWLVARDEGQVIGVLQAADFSADGGGWVRNLGVLPRARGRGVARLLLDQAFAASYARGYTWAGLGVDTQNQTGAYRLYESVGMHVQFESDAWQLAVLATSTGAA